MGLGGKKGIGYFLTGKKAFLTAWARAATLRPMSKAELTDEQFAATVEAMLIASDSALSALKIAAIAEVGTARTVQKAIGTLNARYEQMGAAFRIEEIAGGYQILTLPRYRDVLTRMLQARKETHLTQAAMETLAVVAYRQPVIRADVEAIRGVACGEVLRGLLDKQLIKVVGRAQVLGRPMLYGTTRRFLALFGLGSLEDLPNVQELRKPADAPKPPAPAGDEALTEADQDDENEKEDPPGEDGS